MPMSTRIQLFSAATENFTNSHQLPFIWIYIESANTNPSRIGAVIRWSVPRPTGPGHAQIGCWGGRVAACAINSMPQHTAHACLPAAHMLRVVTL
jgi:hypothetical protein